MSWTPERVETLVKMWSNGQSASQIASELGGVTRNAVIGKVHRLGLSNRGVSTLKEKKSKPTNMEKASIRPKNLKKRKQAEGKSETTLKRQRRSDSIKTSPENKISGEKDKLLRTNKNIIFSANQPLPPQASVSEVSEETLKSVKSLEKKSKKLSLMELTERTCKWPIGDPATEKFWFCGHPAEQGKPYCETHIEIAFQLVTSRRERRSR
jgi:GcrA cell cycle regulator